MCARWVLAVCLLFALPIFGADPSTPEGTVWKIYYYEDKPPSKTHLKYLEKMAGARLYPVPLRPLYPLHPVQLPGVVLHSDPIQDPLHVVGRDNPATDHFELHDYLASKINESTFLNKYSPALAPDSAVGSDYFPLLSSQQLSPEEKLEEIRALINKSKGRSILKDAMGFGSDGQLPKSDENWGEIYREYLKTIKPAIERIRKDIKDEDLVQEEIEKLPNRSGIVLDHLLADPGSVIVQKMIKAPMELRAHIYRGEVLKGATVTRFDQFRKYLSAEQVQAVEAALEKEFLSKVRKDYPKFSAGADILIEVDEHGGLHPKIIDLNFGDESGMLESENDLMVSNLWIEKISGHDTPYLRAFREFERASLPEKYPALLRIKEEFGDWVSKTESSGLWDRIPELYLREIAEAPVADRIKILDESLRQMIAIGPPDGYAPHQLLSMVKDYYPDLKMPEERLKYWQKELQKLDPEIDTFIEEGRLSGKIKWVEREPGKPQYSDREVEKFLSGYFNRMLKARSFLRSQPVTKAEARGFAAYLVRRYISKVPKTGEMGAKLLLALSGKNTLSDSPMAQFVYSKKSKELVETLVRNFEQYSVPSAYNDGKLMTKLLGLNVIDRAAVLTSPAEALALARSHEGGESNALDEHLQAKLKVLIPFLNPPGQPALSLSGCDVLKILSRVK